MRSITVDCSYCGTEYKFRKQERYEAYLRRKDLPLHPACIRAQRENWKKIIVIGFNNPSVDYFTMAKIGDWFATERSRLDIFDRIIHRQLSIYDMTTRPQRGDAIDHIDDDTELVIALHLYGIGKQPGGREPAWSETYCYNRENDRLLPICMEKNIPLVASGDQPWKGMQKQTLISEGIFIYERYNGQTDTQE